MTTNLRESTLYRGAYLAVSLAVLFLDQWTKGIITRTMDVHQSKTIIPNVFDLTYVRNSGAAFGLFASVDSALKAVVLNSVAVVVFLIVSAYALRSSHKSVRLQLGLALILGGAVGNLLDRVRFGYVVDFLDFAVSGHHWPAFNVADSAICIGVAVLFLDMLRHEEEPKPGIDAAPGDSLIFPRLVQIGQFYLPTYGVVLAIAYLTGIWLLRRKALADGLPDQKILDLALYILASAILGAKLLLVLVEWKRYSANPKDLIEVVRSGGVFYGGLICATAVAVWYMKKNGLPAWRIADMGAPSIALGEAMGRWGCFAAGCCYGKESHGPFAVTFSDPFAHEAVGTPLGVPLHPTQIYLSLNAFLIFLILQWAYRRKSFDGEVFWLYVLLYAITRGILETWRGDLVRGFLIPGVLSTSQAIGLVAAAAAGGMLFYLSRRQRAEA